MCGCRWRGSWRCSFCSRSGVRTARLRTPSSTPPTGTGWGRERETGGRIAGCTTRADGSRAGSRSRPRAVGCCRSRCPVPAAGGAAAASCSWPSRSRPAWWADSSRSPTSIAPGIWPASAVTGPTWRCSRTGRTIYPGPPVSPARTRRRDSRWCVSISCGVSAGREPHVPRCSAPAPLESRSRSASRHAAPTSCRTIWPVPAWCGSCSSRSIRGCSRRVALHNNTRASE